MSDPARPKPRGKPPQVRGAPRKVDRATIRIQYGTYRASGLSNVAAVDMLARTHGVDRKTIRNQLGSATERAGLAAHIHVNIKPWPRRKKATAD